MTFKEKVQKVVVEMQAGDLESIVKTVKDRALLKILQEVPKQINELFQKRLKEVDDLIKKQVEKHIETQMSMRKRVAEDR